MDYIQLDCTFIDTDHVMTIESIMIGEGDLILIFLRYFWGKFLIIFSKNNFSCLK